MHDVVIRDLPLLLTMDPSIGEGPLGALTNAAIHLMDGLVAWVGPTVHAPKASEEVDGSGFVALPGLVDCHTHAVWAGSRADEFRRRLAGENYSDILLAGGGILSTVRATREATEEELASLATERLRRMRAKGVTTVEVKSGYGLEAEAERRLLKAALQAGEAADVRVLTTFLGAHTVPAEWRHDPDAYVDQVVEVQLPRVSDVADFIDVYVDRGAFTVTQGERILAAGKAAGLIPRVHAEQVVHTGAAAMAAALGATSADHLEQLDDDGVAAMAEHGTVAVLLPGAMIYLQDPPPPVAKLRAAGVPMAVATDLNPGTSPIDDLWSCATLACLTMGLTMEEALLGITANAAAALGRSDLGRLAPGCVGEVVLARPRPGEPPDVGGLVQHLGAPQVRIVTA